MKSIMKMLSTALLCIGMLMPMQAQSAVIPGATVALISVTQTLDIEAMLTNQGIIFDKFAGPPFDAATVTLVGAGYSSVIVAMNGGAISAADIANVAAYANAGGNLIMLGGTNFQPFRDAVNANLLLIDTLAGWVLQANPTYVAVDPTHYLLAGLTLPYNAVGINTGFRMIVNQDPAAVVAANNSAGEAAVFTKTLTAGLLTWIINAPTDSFWLDPADRAVLDALIINALAGAPAPAPVAGGGGGGGCALNTQADFDPMLPVLALLALVFLYRRRNGAQI